ncbi:meiotic recombination protein SPO11-like isoform X1 [Biomphalaria glabrata]|uniref:DNA topoisomerase (ATP-hydrolyzing) n=2 Tax=Biomphalaria glabrata TaxID=6526 RepID=A0A9W3ADV2_BIOGL|nr:meiotic recombination protein SPO11-like isoform X1 [Biomphalaria glabrata]XP_055885484.1 meiotic recombination protein SPO11-like isoform X1 [Biomphalaria glabrata]XP_055885485.1 meiotic recombination protein SPO11-like isoform X1 [Biomphalaria glabrata]XP_055885486.1 meiotic recombination protein SPO11-like isoform X1 [Biomphalaria glabrata]KAI8749636.1 meiotic recombination protein SPO11-like isoform X1 [Biomphalaria glabrata]
MELRKDCFVSEIGHGILLKIEDICLDIINLTLKDEQPSLFYPRRLKWPSVMQGQGVRSTSAEIPMVQVEFKENKPKSVKKFATMLKILKIIYTLVQEGKYCTKRDIFYQYPDLYPCQAFIDRIIDDIASMLKVPRQELHILATSKGLVSGDLQFENSEGIFIDCQHTAIGVPIAPHSRDMQNLQTQAKFVLVVEKDATFQKLMSHQFCKKMKTCILITGKGYPDNGTLFLLQEIYARQRLPIFVLVDADPHGIEIMAVYKFGSKNQMLDQTLALPSVQWIGILPEEIKRCHIPDSTLCTLSPRHLQMCVHLKSRPYFQHDEYMQSQLDILIELKKKVEIQCLDAISSNYLSDVYLPRKLKDII